MSSLGFILSVSNLSTGDKGKTFSFLTFCLTSLYALQSAWTLICHKLILFFACFLFSVQTHLLLLCASDPLALELCLALGSPGRGFGVFGVRLCVYFALTLLTLITTWQVPTLEVTILSPPAGVTHCAHLFTNSSHFWPTRTTPLPSHSAGQSIQPQSSFRHA